MSEREHNIQFFINNLEVLKNEIIKEREKLSYLQKVYKQFSMLITKTVIDNYGPIIKEKSIEKPEQLFMPDVHSESQTELIRLILTTAPSDVTRFISQSSVVERLIFSNETVFDEILINSLMRASPDIRVAFISIVIDRFKNCGAFLEKILPMLSGISLHPALCGQLLDSGSPMDEFLGFYNSFLNDLCSLLGFKQCKILYKTDENTLLYPSDKYDSIINIDSTLCGELLNLARAQRIHNPYNRELYQTSSEKCIFETNEPVLSKRFSFGSSNGAGIIMFFNSKPFSESDETYIDIVAYYIAPALYLIRHVFLYITPSSFLTLTSYLSKLYQENGQLSQIESVICEMVNASQCKLFAQEPIKGFPNVTVLKDEPSIIRWAVSTGKPQLIVLPRFNPHFRKDIDDIVELPRINSMYVSSVPNTKMIIVVFNSISSNIFTPKQLSKISFFIDSISIVAEHILSIKDMKASNESKTNEVENILKVYDSFRALVSGIQQDCFYEEVLSLVPKGISVQLFYSIDHNRAIEFPSMKIGEIPHFDRTEKNFIISNDDGSSRLVLFSVNSSELCIGLFSGKNEVFTSECINTLTKFGSSLLLVFPWFIRRNTLNEVFKFRNDVRNILHFDTEALSRVIGKNISCEIFEKPISKLPNTNALYTIPVETHRGIEAVISCEENEIDNKIKDTLNVYAVWLMSALSYRRFSVYGATEASNLLIEQGFAKFFKCSEQHLISWVCTIKSVFQSNGIEFNDQFEKYKYIYTIFNQLEWKSIYTTEEFYIFLTICFIFGIHKFWQCKTDSKTLGFSKTCHKESRPLISVIFGNGFGIGYQLKDTDIIPLLVIVENLAMGSSFLNTIEVVSHLVFLKDKEFKYLQDSKFWIAKALIILRDSRVYIRPSLDHKSYNKKSILVQLEKIFVPIYSILMMENPSIEPYLTQIEENMKKIKEINMF